MISSSAIDEIEKMQRDGLSPTPADIIRLNGLGLKCEEAKGKRPSASRMLLPRIAVIGDRLTLRQPTIGHEIWIDAVSRFVDKSDYKTMLAINCFALSRPHRELPDPETPASVETAVRAFAADFADVTRDVLYAAYVYVRFGTDEKTLEVPIKLEDEEEDKQEPNPDECIAVGILNNAVPVLLGLSLADMKSMTSEALRRMTDAAYNLHRRSDAPALDPETKRLGEFYDTVAAIRARLSGESEAMRAAESMPPST